ncbi:MAG TPA: ABC transporter transmembrane domain-containing protein, partial [Gammaproteobacteria bacterium]|nr:ABC transporter transmembrane domain-containing protein [Gammaproteobacteria bacterium]
MSEAAPNAVAVYGRLLRYLRPHWPIVAAVFVPAMIYALLGTLVPYLLSEWIEGLSDPDNADRAWQIPLLIAVVFPFRGAMDFAIVFGLAWVGRSVIRDLRNEVFGHYLELPARFFDQGSSGSLISRLTYNTEQVAEAISGAVVVVLRDTIAVVALLVVLVRMNPQLTVLVVLVGPVIAWLVGAMSRAFRRYSARIQHSMGDVTRLTEQSLHGQRVVKVFEGEEQERQQFGEVNARNFRFHVRLVAIQSLGDNLTQYVVALGVAAVMYFSFDDLDAASFLGFITATGMVVAPMKRLLNIN